MQNPLPSDPPIPPELPLGFGAAFLALTVAFAIGQFNDQLLLMGLFAVVGVVSLIIAAVLAGRSEAEAGRVEDHMHAPPSH
jgi:hypothetical protein